MKVLSSFNMILYSIIFITCFHQTVLGNKLLLTDDITKEAIVDKYPQCFEGPSRSPININISDVKFVNWSPLKLTTKDGKISNLAMKTDLFSHILMETDEAGFETTLSGGGLEGEYELKEIQWSTEDRKGSKGYKFGHSFSGAKHVSEMHFVFAKQGWTLEEAKQSTGKVAIVAVFIEMLGDSDDSRITTRFNDSLIKHQLADQKMTLNYGLNYLFPRDMTTFFRYEGSFVRPPCSSGVIWTIMAEPLFMSITDSLANFYSFLHLQIGVNHGIDDYMDELPSSHNRLVYMNKGLTNSSDDVIVNKVVQQREDQIVSIVLIILIVVMVVGTVSYTRYRKWKVNKNAMSFDNVISHM